MKAQFANKLLSSPWHLTREQGRLIIASIISRLRSERPAEDICGDPLPKMQIVGDVAIIPVTGVLAVNLPDWIKAYGLNMTDANDIAEELQSAVSNEMVSMIVLDVDSPGGMSIAGDKLFDRVEAAARRKPVFAWCADGNQICSSAYEAAAPARAIFSGPHCAGIGCVGTYSAWLDDTAFWLQQGMKWEVFRSGDYKGIGEDAMDEKQRAFLQAIVDEFGARFRKNVSKYRRDIADEDLQGQWYFAAEATKRGFTAGVALDMPAAIKRFRALL